MVTNDSRATQAGASALAWMSRHKAMTALGGLLALGAVGNAVDTAPGDSSRSSATSPATLAPEIVETTLAAPQVEPAASATSAPRPRAAAIAPLLTKPKPAATTAVPVRTATTVKTASPVKSTAPVPAPVSVPAAKTYANCDALHQDYPHGVGRPGATDHTSGSTPVTTFTVNRAVYDANTGRDRDDDGIACEKA